MHTRGNYHEVVPEAALSQAREWDVFAVDREDVSQQVVRLLSASVTARDQSYEQQDDVEPGLNESRVLFGLDDPQLWLDSGEHVSANSSLQQSSSPPRGQAC